MRKTAVVDSGPFVALFDKDDKYHNQTKERIIAFREEKGRLMTTWAVLTEVAYLLHTRISLKAELRFLEWLSLDNVGIVTLEIIHMNQIIKLQDKYSSRLMDFADATVLIAAEIIQTQQVFSLDFKDFFIYRSLHGKPFQNLLGN